MTSIITLHALHTLVDMFTVGTCLERWWFALEFSKILKYMYAQVSFDLSQILSQSHCSDWWLKSELRDLGIFKNPQVSACSCYKFSFSANNIHGLSWLWSLWRLSGGGLCHKTYLERPLLLKDHILMYLSPVATVLLPVAQSFKTGHLPCHYK